MWLREILHALSASTFTFTLLADALVQSDLQLSSQEFQICLTDNKKTRKTLKLWVNVTSLVVLYVVEDQFLNKASSKTVPMKPSVGIPANSNFCDSSI